MKKVKVIAYYKRKWTWLLFSFCAIFFVIFLVTEKTEESSRRTKNLEDSKREEKHCSHNQHQEEEIEYYNPFGGWECEYCGELMDGKWIPKNQPFWPTLLPLIKKHLQECQKAQVVINNPPSNKIDNNFSHSKSSLETENYCESELKNWGLKGKVNLPNLKEKKRIGATKILGIKIIKEKKGQKLVSKNIFSQANELIVFLLSSCNSTTYQNFTELVKGDKKPDFFYSSHAKEKLKTYERIVTSFFIQRILKRKEVWKHNVFVLEFDGDKFVSFKVKKASGESGTVSLYLILLSAYYQKPISQEVVASAFLEIGDYLQFEDCPWCLQEEIIKDPFFQLSRDKISPVNGLEHKIKAAVEAGVKKLILSAEQQEDYEKNIPQEIKEKLKVYYVKNVEELEKLFWAGEFS